jgi:hypothetical protein
MIEEFENLNKAWQAFKISVYEAMRIPELAKWLSKKLR